MSSFSHETQERTCQRPRSQGATNAKIALLRGRCFDEGDEGGERAAVERVVSFCHDELCTHKRVCCVLIDTSKEGDIARETESERRDRERDSDGERERRETQRERERNIKIERKRERETQ